MGPLGTVFEGLSAAEALFLHQLGAGIADADVHSQARILGLSDDHFHQLMRSLKGLLIADQDLALSGARDERMLPEHTAIMARYHRSSTGFMANRKERVVHLVGLGRLGALVALLLTNAGIGTLLLEDDSSVTSLDVGPCGYGEADIGLVRSHVARRLVQATNPGSHSHVLRDGGAGGPNSACVDLAIVIAHDAVPTPLAARFMNSGRPHLFIVIREQEAALGPLIVPGQTACAECVELHRNDLDPQWLHVCAQLTSADAKKPPTPPHLENATQAMAVAGTAVAQALLLLDGVNKPSLLSAVMTFHSDNARWSRQEFVPHNDCSCQWQAQALATISNTASP